MNTNDRNNLDTFFILICHPPKKKKTWLKDINYLCLLSHLCFLQSSHINLKKKKKVIA